MTDSNSNFDATVFLSKMFDAAITGNSEQLNTYISDLIGFVVNQLPCNESNEVLTRLEDHQQINSEDAGEQTLLEEAGFEEVQEEQPQSDDSQYEYEQIQNEYSQAEQSQNEYSQCDQPQQENSNTCEYPHDDSSTQLLQSSRSPSSQYAYNTIRTDSESNYLKMQMGIYPEVLRTHSHIIIRANIPLGCSEKDLRITVKEGHVAVKWNSRYLEQIVALPDDAVCEEACAVIKDRVLEINIPRENSGNTRSVSIDKDIQY